MSTTREKDIVQAFVSLSNELVEGYDTIDLLSGLTTDCARLVGVASVGLLLADGKGVLHVVAASSERTRVLELFQLQREEGPCLECFHSGQPVAVPDLRAESARFPAFVEAATSLGFSAVHALPMRLRQEVLGALGLFSTDTGRLHDDDLELAQALVHVASVALVNATAAANSATVNAQLQEALDSRVVLEQAKGVIAERGGVDMDLAYRVLRRYARDHQLRLADTARAVTMRELPAGEVVAHAVSVALLPAP